MPDIYLGDKGVIFNIDTESTMTGLTSGSVNMIKPDGSLVTWTATTHATEETYLTFTATTTEFTSTEPSGDWRGQSHVILGAASSISIHGDPFIIKVGEPL